MNAVGCESTGWASRGWWLAFCLLLAWQLVGVWPTAPVEGDAEAVAAGAESLAAGGLAASERCYRYAGQVGTYAVLAGIRSLSGVACFPAFGALSAAAALAFVLLGAVLLRRLLGVPYAVAGLALLLFQETGAAAFYANSTILAAAALLLACAVAVSGDGGWARGLLSGLALAVAGLLRADVVLMAPVLPVLLHRGDRWRTASATMACAGAAFAVYGAVSAALGAGPLAALHEAVGHMGGSASVSLEVPGWLGHESVRSAVAFLSPAWALAVGLGGAALVRRGRWRLLFLAAVGTVPLLAAYAGNLSSPKYLTYAIPFLVLVGLAAFAEPVRGWRSAAALMVALLLLHQLVGLRVVVRSKPWIAPPPGALLIVGSEPAGGPVERAELALGGGTLVPTADGFRLSSGLAFAPLVWHRAKVATRRCQLQLDELLAATRTTPREVISGSWLALNTVDLALWQVGFVPVERERLPFPSGRRSVWRRGRETVIHTSAEVYSYRWQDRAWFLRHASHARALYVAGGGRERAAMLEHTVARTVCDDVGPTCIALLDLDLAGSPGVATPAAIRRRAAPALSLP